MQPPEAKKHCEVWAPTHFEERLRGTIRHPKPRFGLAGGRGETAFAKSTGNLPPVTRESQTTPGNPLCHAGRISRQKRKKRVAGSH